MEINSANTLVAEMAGIILPTDMNYIYIDSIKQVRDLEFFTGRLGISHYCCIWLGANSADRFRSQLSI